MLVSMENLASLEAPIMAYLQNNISEDLVKLNRNEKLGQFLDMLNLGSLLNIPKRLETKKYGKILVIGESSIQIKNLIGIAKQLGINKNRFEFVTNYENTKSYNFAALEYNINYKVVLVGPLPHKCIGLDGDKYNSVLDQMEDNPGSFPKIVRLVSSNELKISKTSFKNALISSLKDAYI
jgi:hypothetical protein